MLDELYNYFLDFFSLLFSGLMNFIRSNEIVFYFFVIPIATSVILFAGYFLIDISHVLDDYNAKNTFLYKGMKNYDKQQAQQRKSQNREKTVKYGEFTKNSFENKLRQVDKKYKGQRADFSKLPYSRSIIYNNPKPKPRKINGVDIEVED